MERPPRIGSSTVGTGSSRRRSLNGSTEELAGPMPTTEEEWRRRLTPEQFDVLCSTGPERPFTAKHVSSNEPGRVSTRGVRRRSVQLRDEVRLRHRLAEFLGADRTRGRATSGGRQPMDAWHPRSRARAAGAT